MTVNCFASAMRFNSRFSEPEAETRHARAAGLERALLSGLLIVAHGSQLRIPFWHKLVRASVLMLMDMSG